MGNIISFVLSIPCNTYQGIHRQAKWFISYFFIISRKRNSRVFKYDMVADGKPFKVGFFIPPEEWELECDSGNQDKDEMFCFGGNSSGECLALQIARDGECDSFFSLFLMLNGHTYTLPAKFDCLSSNDKKMFGNNRFFMQCLVPFRKWKIFFNGMLRRIGSADDKEMDDITHVRFSFVWVASSGIFDFLSDYSSSNMADILSKMEWNSLKPPIDRLLSNFNEYHQPGMMKGSVQIGKESVQEICLWGCRRHAFLDEKREDFGSYLDVFGNTENGFFFFFKIMSAKNSAAVKNIAGYVMQPNGLLKAAHILSAKRIVKETKNILSFKVKAAGLHYDIAAFLYEYGRMYGKEFCDNIALSVIDVIVNGFWGSGIIIERKSEKRIECHKKCKRISALIKSKSDSEISNDPFILPLNETRCLHRSLSGNLGSTLAKLMLMKDLISGYDIPYCLIVTTTAYEEYISAIKQSILTLKDTAWKYDMDKLTMLCEMVVDEVSNSYLSPALHDSLFDNLYLILKDGGNVNIYPSVIGTDTDVQLLEAYLTRFHNIYGVVQAVICIKKCWASQFSLGAVLCKRSTGLSINVPMAIIIQKIVPLCTSGVISSSESSTGNPSVLEIREKVDKASYHGIRITRLKRDLKNRIVILDSNTVRDGYDSAYDKDDKTDDSSNSNKSNINKKVYFTVQQQSLSNEQIIFLGRLACKLEAYFHFPLAIEWCMSKKNFFIIQARSITFLNAEEKSEIIHYHDTYIRSEDDWFSAFITGEAFLGPITPLGINMINLYIGIFIAKLNLVTFDFWDIQTPYFPKFLTYSHYHMMYCMADGILRLLCLHDGPFFQTVLFIINLKFPAKEALLEFIWYRHGHNNLSFKMILKVILILLLPIKKLEKLEDQINKNNFNLANFDSALEILDAMSKKYQDLTEPILCFMKCTFRTLLWSMLIFYILGKNAQDAKNVHKDFNCLMSACSMSEEGDIAFDILTLSKKIARTIDPMFFKKMPVQDAKIWLEDIEVDKRIHFSDFLKKHGHRCHREIDIFQKCWSMNFESVIHVLQVLVPHSAKNLELTTYSLDPVFSQLSVMPSYFEKVFLKYAVPKCIATLKEAKKAKSCMLKAASFWREAFHHLAHKSVKEFHLPFPEALFFLSLDEINQIFTAYSPRLVTKALKCWEIYADLDKYIFPVIAIGCPFPLHENYYAKRRMKVGSCLRGCPMSRGTIIGTAIVITNFNEKIIIEKDCILITHSPSIVWSLYFPILSGFAADLGGVLSDGAVAAREYQLPCVINLVRASQVFKTGDRVFLDGNMGILRRIS